MHKGSILDNIVRISKYDIFYCCNAQRQQVRETILVGTQTGSTRELSLWKERSKYKGLFSLEHFVSTREYYL